MHPWEAPHKQTEHNGQRCGKQIAIDDAEERGHYMLQQDPLLYQLDHAQDNLPGRWENEAATDTDGYPPQSHTTSDDSNGKEGPDSIVHRGQSPLTGGS